MLTKPGWMLRVEEACLLAFAIWAYAHLGVSWWLFAALILAPDLFMLGFLVNKRVGSAVYNFAHWLVWPVALIAVGYAESKARMMAVGLIWFAHIALDRLCGYGLKYPTGFKDTHLQRVDAVAGQG